MGAVLIALAASGAVTFVLTYAISYFGFRLIDTRARR